MKLIKDKKGSAFIVVIISMAVLLILATTIASIAASNFEMSHAERRYQAAYYVAEAGLRHQIEHMRLRMEELHSRQVPPANAGAFFTAFNQGWINTPLIMQNLGVDSARVDIILPPPEIPSITGTGNKRIYTFDSRATVGNVRRTIRGSVEIEWALMQAPPDYFRLALFSRGSLAISGNPTITGGIGTNAATVQISGNPNISGGIHTNMNSPTPAIILPSNLHLRVDLDIKNKDVVTISENGRYDIIDVKGTLRFDLSAGDLLIQVDTLKMSSGVIETIGGGRLFLFVDGNLVLSGNDHINQERANNMVMFVTGSSISISGNAVFAGGLYAPNASLSISGGGEYSGGFMVNAVSISGNPNISHVPITSTGISSYMGSIPGFVPPERMFIINPWREP